MITGANASGRKARDWSERPVRTLKTIRTIKNSIRVCELCKENGGLVIIVAVMIDEEQFERYTLCGQDECKAKLLELI